MRDTPPARTTPSRPRRRLNPQTAAFGALALAAGTLFSVLVPVHISLYAQPPALAFVFGTLLCAAPLLAVRFPRWSIVMFTVSAVTVPLPAVAPNTALWPWPWSVPSMLVLTLFVGVLTIVHGWRLALTAWLLAIAGTLTVVLALSTTVPVVAAIVDLVIVTSVSGAALVVAALVASRLRIAAELTRERELTATEQSRRVLVEERTRIARELHDVVAHGMSLIQVQASTARYRVGDLSDAAIREFDEIAQTARDGLTEMRRLLGVLRTDDQRADLTPQQGLRDLPDLVQAVRRAGADVDAALAGVSAELPGAVDIAAFRIVQEALSNAVRHAPHAHIRLTVETDAELVRIEVHNGPGDSGAPVPGAASRGHGILGMKERAALVGGNVTAAASADGGWTVRALLPLAAPRVPASPSPQTDAGAS